jgi:hypothetical protein
MNLFTSPLALESKNTKDNSSESENNAVAVEMLNGKTKMIFILRNCVIFLHAIDFNRRIETSNSQLSTEIFLFSHFF